MFSELGIFWRRKVKPFFLEVWEVAREYPSVTCFWVIVAGICYFL